MYGTQQKPPKINLLDERPRRESIVEQHLSQTIVRPPAHESSDYYQLGDLNIPMGQQHQQQQQYAGYPSSSLSHNIINNNNDNINQRSQNSSSMFIPNQSTTPQAAATTSYSNIITEQSTKTTKTTTNSSPGHRINDFASTSTSQQLYAVAGPGGSGRPYVPPQSQQQQQFRQQYQQPAHANPAMKTVTTQMSSRSQTSERNPSVYSELVEDLKAKEEKLMCEIAYMNQYIRNPWARPKQTRDPRREPPPRMSAKNDHRWVRECPPTTSLSRPTSRASSTRSNTEAELMEKASKLMQDAEEMEKKPITPQQMVIETGTRPRSAPEKSMSPDAGSYHTAIIKVPKGEIDNRSPLPFAFDNFSTLGVRGNVASVGAAPPEKPYAPIFPVVKRTPSPGSRR